jgi:NAD(P)H-hydrate epimerase
MITKQVNPNTFLMEKEALAPLFPPRKLDSHKGRFGHLLVVAGSPGKTGAAALCANAAQRTGTGLVTLGVAESLNPVMETLVVEPMTCPLPEEVPGHLSLDSLDAIQALAQTRQALALGPGLGTRAATQDLVRKLVKKVPIPLILDADGLNAVAEDPACLKTRTAPTILTPHPGEMARLTGKTTVQIQADRLGTAREFAEKFQVVLVLKGARTLVACPDSSVYICPTGNPGMAAGGTGDVLTGMIAGLAAQGMAPAKAAMAGVYVHGWCGDLLARTTHAFGYTASDMVKTIPATLAGFES